MKGMMVALMAALWLLQGGLKADGKAGSQVEDRAGGQADTLRVMFWNLENFFDWKNDSTSVSDAEFSSRGERHWTRRRFQAKADAIAKALLWTAGQEGGLPDAVGFAEVENAFVLRCLLQGTALRKLDYRLVHFDSGDPRGIDVAFLYRSSRLELLSAKACPLYEADSSRMATRDILLVQVRTRRADTLTFLINHHPSKYGGAEVSEPRRKRAVERLRALADSLAPAPVVAMGDFNDTPDNPLYRRLEPLRNLALPLHNKGEGTIKYQGKWELIDLFFVSPQVRTSAMKIVRIPFLMAPDKAFSGEKPLRTYSGPRYLGGVSDHCPIWLNVKE